MSIKYQSIDCSGEWLSVGQACNEHGSYVNATLAVRNTWHGKLIQRFCVWLWACTEWTSKYDADSLNLRDGEMYPMYSLTYWLMFPYKWLNKWATRRPSETFYHQREQGE